MKKKCIITDISFPKYNKDTNYVIITLSVCGPVSDNELKNILEKFKKNDSVILDL